VAQVAKDTSFHSSAFIFLFLNYSILNLKECHFYADFCWSHRLQNWIFLFPHLIRLNKQLFGWFLFVKCWKLKSQSKPLYTNRRKNMAYKIMLEVAPETFTILHRFCRVALVTPSSRRLLPSLWTLARDLVARQTRAQRYRRRAPTLPVLFWACFVPGIGNALCFFFNPFLWWPFECSGSVDFCYL